MYTHDEITISYDVFSSVFGLNRSIGKEEELMMRGARICDRSSPHQQKLYYTSHYYISKIRFLETYT